MSADEPALAAVQKITVGQSIVSREMKQVKIENGSVQKWARN